METSEISATNLYKDYFALKISDKEGVVTNLSKVLKLATEIEDQRIKLSNCMKIV